MKIGLLLACLAISGNIFSQTENHKPIPGTKYSMIPPKGFVLSKDFSGFRNPDNGGSIMLIVLPVDFQSVSAGFTEAGLKSKGMTELDRQTVDFNSSKATLVKVSQQSAGTTYMKQMLLFGDSMKTILVNGTYPEESKNIENAIKTSLLSISYNEDQNDDPLEVVAFSIDVTGSDFKFTKNISGTLLYTTDGEIPTKSAYQTSIILSPSPGSVATTDKKQVSIAMLKQMVRGESNIPKEINPITINNLKGFEIVADGKNANNQKELVYVVTLFKESGECYLFRGSTSGKFDLYLTVFRKIARTFKLK